VAVPSQKFEAKSFLGILSTVSFGCELLTSNLVLLANGSKYGSIEHMEIRLCTTKEEWESSPAVQTGEFLQSYEWGEFQLSVGYEPVRLQVLDDSKIIWQGQGFAHRLPFGFRYIYFPRISNIDERILAVVYTWLSEKKFVFARIEPVQPIINYQLPTTPTPNRQPKRTLALDLRKSEDELLSGMHHKTRYNIRVAQKHGIEIKTEKNAEIFWKLNSETTARDKFKSHDKVYYEKMLSCPLTRQYTAWYNGVPIASHIHVVHGDVWTYLHGTSGNEHRNVMAPYLLHWYSIQQAKEIGCSVYDFWGIAPAAAEGAVVSEYNGTTWQADHGWTGITRYKTGFGGEVREYPGAFEISIRPFWYRAIEMVKKFKN
jgi:peptidoglycan pentaglycine glycine transferase (the first glycine)